MPHNPHRGEIEARLDGAPHRLCLTLGALAELEAAFGDSDMLALAQRFETGRLSATDAVRIIGAGLRGAGHDIADGQVARMQAEGGAAGFVDIVARLLAVTFGGGDVRPVLPGAGAKTGSDTIAPPSPLRGGDGGGGTPASAASVISASPEGRAAPAPFPGPR